jgi:hypothetical protein
MGAQGAIRVAKGGFRTYTRQDGLDTDNIRSILETRSGPALRCQRRASTGAKPVNCLMGGNFIAVRPNIPRYHRRLGLE